MSTHTANADPRLSFWLRVREYAVPLPMIETATARRHTGDWAGACAAAGIDVDLNLRSAARTHGRDLAARVRADLRHLAPDLLRWHMPRIAPDGLLRPGLTLTLARYDTVGRDGTDPVHLVVRTPPARADGGQRISLALWDGSRDDRSRRHPHPYPSRRFRLDLHRHLWDARRSGELRIRSGADRPPVTEHVVWGPDPGETVPPGRRRAVDRWAAEAAILLGCEGRSDGQVCVRLGARHRLVLDVAAGRGGTRPTPPRITAVTTDDGSRPLPVLPHAATWVLPDLELLRSGAIEAGRLHPLVVSALVPDHTPAAAPRTTDPAAPARLVECRGARHHIGLVDGVLAPLDHAPEEIRREELLAALGGPPLPCLRAIDEAHRRPDCLAGVRDRLGHGDIAGALAVVEGLLGPDAVLRDGALRDALEAAAQRRTAYGMFRAGLAGDESAPVPPARPGRPRVRRTRPRHAAFH
ncbi:hypothetical protein ACIBBD_31195 [Streptomyces sp. NPDC051315]|uniref:hypothetical protein n=1 Tax=Streptomyces sp. NPDC051315 TaxID=3365650 RepID=UPI003793B2FC